MNAKRFDNYTVAHYIEGDYAEAISYRHKMVREDQLSAIGYALGATEPITTPMPFDDIQYLPSDCGRSPGRILSVGSGRGELEAVLAKFHLEYLAIDPSPGAAVLTPLTIVQWVGANGVFFARVALGDFNPPYSFDTVIVSESIEHIPKKEFARVPEWCKEWGARLIITNNLDYHPIPKDSDWNHLRTIDDRVYNELESLGGTTVIRRQSHLVIQF